MSETRLVVMTEEQAKRIRALASPGPVALDLADAFDDGITEEELQPVRELIRYRVADPDARRLGDWSVALHDKFNAAFSDSTSRTGEGS